MILLVTLWPRHWFSGATFCCNSVSVFVTWSKQAGCPRVACSTTLTVCFTSPTQRHCSCGCKSWSAQDPLRQLVRNNHKKNTTSNHCYHITTVTCRWCWRRLSWKTKSSEGLLLAAVLVWLICLATVYTCVSDGSCSYFLIEGKQTGLKLKKKKKKKSNKCCPHHIYNEKTLLRSSLVFFISWPYLISVGFWYGTSLTETDRLTDRQSTNLRKCFGSPGLSGRRPAGKWTTLRHTGR